MTALPFARRVRAAARVAAVHLLVSALVAAAVAALVLWVWYPAPYDLLSGGRHLFFILIGVDVVCGPLLTWILFNPAKSRRERWVDVSLVVLIQLAALAYGVHTVYEARPLYLVHERDRFRAIALPDYGDADVRLPTSLGEALQALQGDSTLVDAFGSAFIQYFTRIKQSELSRYELAEDKDDFQRREYFSRF